MVRVATRQGLQSRSFELAAAAFTDAVGCFISGESVRRLTQGWGAAVHQKRQTDAEERFAYDQEVTKQPEVVDPIGAQASVSTDGGMVRIRGEGWKEVKLVTVSAVRPKRETERGPHPDGRRYAAYEPQMMLERHSYQGGLWSADEIAPHQYVEALRRGVHQCRKSSSVNDGAEWIQRITSENFPKMTQIIDWFHAAEKMWLIGKLCLADLSQRSVWVEARLDELWSGNLTAVNQALAHIDLSTATDPDEAEMAIGYFHRQQQRMQYHRYRIAGYPIGSGCVESGINTVVHHRLKRQGRGWKRDNAQSMLAALGELHSRRFEYAWVNCRN